MTTFFVKKRSLRKLIPTISGTSDIPRRPFILNRRVGKSPKKTLKIEKYRCSNLNYSRYLLKCLLGMEEVFIQIKAISKGSRGKGRFDPRYRTNEIRVKGDRRVFLLSVLMCVAIFMPFSF